MSRANQDLTSGSAVPDRVFRNPRTNVVARNAVVATASANRSSVWASIALLLCRYEHKFSTGPDRILLAFTWSP